MKKLIKTCLQILICSITAITSAQLTFIDKIVTPLEESSLFFEKVFIHTNKTSYSSNDNIWFKAYVGNYNNIPSLKTTHLYVDLIDKKGAVIQTRNILIYKGIGKGQFELNDSLKFGEYYIRAYTNYMRNFGEDNAFIQKITILNTIIEKNSVIKNKYDVQLFPEGGYLLKNVTNRVAIKSLINGNSFNYHGTIVNSKNQEVARFKSEYKGMTTCDFFYKEEEKYTALVNINDTVLKVKMPLVKNKGLIINATKKESFINLTIKTNNNSLAEIDKKKYNLLLHQRNKIVAFLEIPKIDSLDVQLNIKKENFLNGVNTITLFENNIPILERKIYIEKQNQEAAISLNKISIEKDSVQYKLKVSKPNTNELLKTNVSISVMPLNAQKYTKSATIKSAFLLTPYIKGYVENPGYYFNKKNTKRIAHLDLLLLTQGWTQYSSDEIINNLNQPFEHDFKTGYNLKGIVSPLYTNQLALINKDDVLIDKLFLKGNTNFNFKKLLIYKGDTVKISFLNNINVSIKPKNIVFDSIKTRTFAKFIPENLGINSEKKIFHTKEWKDFHYSNSEILKEVIVIGKKRSKTYLEKKKWVKKYKPMVFDIGLYYQLKVLDYYKNNNYNLMKFLAFEENVRLTNWNGVENYLSIGGNKEAVLFIDGKKITSGWLPSVSINMNDIENVMVQPDRGNLLIQAFTTENYKKNITLLFNDYIFKEGYDRSKKYYTPAYNFSRKTNPIEIDWKPNLTTNDSGEVFFKIKPNKEVKSYLFSIEGFSESGQLISETVKGY
jgi:hypothetical protein